MTDAEYAAHPADLLRDLWAEHDQLFRIPFGIPFLDDALLGLFPREVTLIGARSGGGKTEAATQILITQQIAGREVLYFALDHDDQEIEKRILWRNIISEVRKTRPPHLTNVYLRYANWRAGEYRDLLKEVERSASVYRDQLFQTCDSKIIYRRNELSGEDIASIIEDESSGLFRLVIIDHFHAIKHTGNKFEDQARAMALICEAAKKTQRPVLIMGQFKKRAAGNKAPIPDMEEFSGVSDLFYLPNNVIVFAPDYSQDADRGSTFFHIAKARIGSDAKAYVGVHAFDIEAHKYSNEYFVRRFKPFDSPEALPGIQIPRWAKNALPENSEATVFKPRFKSKPYKED